MNAHDPPVYLPCLRSSLRKRVSPPCSSIGCTPLYTTITMRAAHISGLNSKINRLRSLPSRTRCASSTMVVPTPPAAFDTPALSLIRDLNQKYSKVRYQSPNACIGLSCQTSPTGFVEVCPPDQSSHACCRFIPRTKRTFGLPRWPCRFVIDFFSVLT